ncbi:MAG: hypothetical protein ABEK04_03425 [Candidatus Nanohalobium sp.]
MREFEFTEPEIGALLGVIGYYENHAPDPEGRREELSQAILMDAKAKLEEDTDE